MSAGFQIIGTTGLNRVITAINVRDAGGTDRVIKTGRIRGPDKGDRVFFDTTGAASFSASASPASVFGHGAGTATSGVTTVTVTGGTPPYFHSWACTQHDNSTPPTATAPASASTAFTQTNLGSDQGYSSTWVDTVTDSAVPPNSATATVRASFWDSSTL